MNFFTSLTPNKMKKNTTTALAMLLVFLYHQPLQAQQLYFDLATGYSLPAAPNLLSATDYNSTADGVNTAKRIRGTGSFGKGVPITASVGYNFNEHLSAELGLGYLVGATIRYREVETHAAYSYKSETTIAGSMFRLSPCLKLTTGTTMLRPYMRMGVVIGAGARLKETFNSTEITDANNDERVRESVFKGGLSLGFTGALGIHYKLDERWSFFAEANLIAQSWAPKKSTLTKAEENGKDVLPTLSTRDKEMEFVNQYTETVTPNENEPQQMLKIYFPFSSAGVQVGLHLLLGNSR